MAMTMVMRRLHPLLDERDDYPLPPREIVEQVGPDGDEQDARSGTLAAHFGYGALTGAVFALLPAFRGGGALYGVGVWALSYLGWIPAARILAPAWRHPAERNLLMIVVHLVWGAALATSLRELDAAERDAFGRSGDTGASIPEMRETGMIR